jgi:hypothetical protein
MGRSNKKTPQRSRRWALDPNPGRDPERGLLVNGEEPAIGLLESRSRLRLTLPNPDMYRFGPSARRQSERHARSGCLIN